MQTVRAAALHVPLIILFFIQINFYVLILYDMTKAIEQNKYLETNLCVKFWM